MLTVEIERHRFVEYLRGRAWLRGFAAGLATGIGLATLAVLVLW
jgi:hypothetical protein